MLTFTEGLRKAFLQPLTLLVGLLFITAGTGMGSEVQAQNEPIIVHQEIECLVADQHAILQAEVQPESDIRAVRVYFRSALYSEFYYVEMVREGTGFQVVLPKPKPETKRVVYYIEAVSQTFFTARSPNYQPEVVREEDECKDRRPAAAYFPGSNPNIVVGALQAGAAAIPPGFQSAGLAGGALISATTGVLIGAAGAGVVTAAVVASGGDEGSGLPPISPPGTTSTSTIASSTTTSTAPPPSSVTPIACFATEPTPPVIEIGGRVRFDAGCSKPAGGVAQREIVSYIWDFGDGGPGKDGRIVHRTYRSPGIFRTTLTVTNEEGNQDTEDRDIRVETVTTTTTTPKPPTTSTTSTSTTTTIPDEADVKVTKTGPSSVAPGGSITYTIKVTNKGPKDALTLNLTDDLPAGVDLVSIVLAPPTASVCVEDYINDKVTCDTTSMVAFGSFGLKINATAPTSGSTFDNTVDVSTVSPPDPDLTNNSATWYTNLSVVASRTLDRQGALETSLTSSLEVPPADGATQAQVLLNQARVDPTNNATPYRHQFSGRVGENVVEARIVSGDSRQGLWRFDFRESSHFVRGSIAVDSGRVVSRGPREVVFRVRGSAGQQIRFRYRLSR